MPLLRSPMDARKGFNLGHFRAALAALQSLPESIDRAVPTHFGGDDPGLADALVATAQAQDRQTVVTEFIAQLGDLGHPAHTVQRYSTYVPVPNGRSVEEERG